MALAGPAAPGPEVCELHVKELPAWVQLPGVCSPVSRSVLRPGGVGGHIQGFWRKVSVFLLIKNGAEHLLADSFTFGISQVLN